MVLSPSPPSCPIFSLPIGKPSCLVPSLSMLSMLRFNRFERRLAPLDRSDARPAGGASAHYCTAVS
eukprot:9483315-Pyramimonas_sp.AAC.1